MYFLIKTTNWGYIIKMIISFATIIIAFVSIMYELVLSQHMTTLFGGTINQYTITIGLYASSMGIGSLFFNKFNNNIPKNFIQLELLLSIFGALSPLLLIIIKPFVSITILYGISLFLIFTIGFLSGLEIPFLMELETNQSDKFSSKIFFLDYLGCLIGFLFYPFIIYILDTFTIAIIMSLFNLCTAFMIAKKYRIPSTNLVLLIILFSILLLSNTYLLKTMQFFFIS